MDRTRWRVQATMGGTLTDEEVQVLVVGTAGVGANWNDQTVMVRLRIDAEPDTAVPEAWDAFQTFEPVQRLIRAGRLTQPQQFTVETEEAHRQGLNILGTKEAARLLGMTDANVRRLKDTDPTFPRPHAVPGAAGDFYDRLDLEQYKRSRQPGTPDAGRPRASDEVLLDHALTVVKSYPALSPGQRQRIEQVLETHGGRYVRGKARVLLDVHQAQTATAVQLMSFGQHTAPDLRYHDAVLRAQEMWPTIAGR